MNISISIGGSKPGGTSGLPAINNWKPKLVGLLTLIIPVLQAINAPDWKSVFSNPTALLGAAVAVLAFVTKQHNTTGGTVPQPSTLEAVAASRVDAKTAEPITAAKLDAAVNEAATVPK